LGGDVEVVLVGDEAGMAEVASELGVKHLSGVICNKNGTPLVSSIFSLARTVNDSPLLAYINADVMLMPDFIQSCRQINVLKSKYLVVGQRWDLDIKEPLDFSNGWDKRLAEKVRQSARLHPPGGSDYFAFPRDCFEDMPDFAIGRAGWDNWMIFQARYRGWPVVDATRTITVIHQTHDYAHLPGGQPHYRLPETDENVRLAGGLCTIFRLEDANYLFEEGTLRRSSFRWVKFWREIEIFPLIQLHSRFLGQLFFAVFHPLRAYRESRAWLR
jgi:hypothetical protein